VRYADDAPRCAIGIGHSGIISEKSFGSWGVEEQLSGEHAKGERAEKQTEGTPAGELL
jgi:hypothetical protein